MWLLLRLASADGMGGGGIVLRKVRPAINMLPAAAAVVVAAAAAAAAAATTAATTAAATAAAGAILSHALLKALGRPRGPLCTPPTGVSRPTLRPTLNIAIGSIAITLHHALTQGPHGVVSRGTDTRSRSCGTVRMALQRPPQLNTIIIIIMAV